MKKSNPDRGVLLICLIATVLVAMFGGLIISAESANPIETFMFFFRDGMTLPEADSENLELPGEASDGPTFIVPDITYPAETTGEAATVPETTLTPETTSAPDTIPEQTEGTVPKPDTTVKPPDTTSRPETTKAPETTKKPETTKAPETTKKPDTTKTPETTRPTVTTSPNTTVPPNDEDYFSDALFLGDSRTVGFYLYARIPGATYFARTSMNVYNVFDKKVSETKDTASYDLSELLSKKKFGKIYILLGINEIGYSYTSVVSNYTKVIDYIKQYQPDAKIIIQSNMHVTKKKSDANPNTFSNTRIDELNRRLSQLADNKKVFYLGFEEIFDDASGAMSPEYSGDGVHLYGKCYKLWRDWMLKNGKIY